MLTVIAIALTIIILQNARIIQPTKASTSREVIDVNIAEVGGMQTLGTLRIGTYGPLEVEVTNQKSGGMNQPLEVEVVNEPLRIRQADW